MDFHWMVLCSSVILSLCMMCDCTDIDTEFSGDEADRLRRLWLLSMKGTKVKEKVNPAGGANTHQLLYCRIGIGFHLQILRNGSVCGVHEPSEYSLLRVFATSPGVVGIYGVRSQLYLCMNEKGIALGMKQFSNECLFKEHMEENYHNTYSSLSYPRLYLALSQKGRMKRGNRVRPHQTCTHFLPRKSH
ncbi:fibroblast growth factor 4A [Paramisgurnus dabryanus]|uniref:fibroblast growth factor 4A n=1 Tax=Paramisgurnus dabryanus TaxID=90735 RepID=UPI0031F3B986